MEQQSIKTENKYREINIGSQYQMVMDILCFIIMTVMFYLREGDIKVGGFGVMYYYIAAIFLVGIAFIDLLLRPNIKRFNILINGSMIYIMPYMIQNNKEESLLLIMFVHLGDFLEFLLLCIQITAACRGNCILFFQFQVGVPAFGIQLP